jgi:formate C-acetyltransferase
MATQESLSQIALTDRVARLRNRIVEAPREVCIERARYLTRSMSANWDEHPLTRMSLALEQVLESISVIIREDELIVGCRTSKLKGAPLFPENKYRWIEKDMEGIHERHRRSATAIDAAPAGGAVRRQRALL